MSFHGVPERTLHLGDPYHCECHKTGRLLAAPGPAQGPLQAHLPVALWQGQVAGALHRAQLVALAQAGTARVDVVCPGFTSDCLETLEEINQEAREAFLHAGGKEFHYIPCLNDDAAWIRPARRWTLQRSRPSARPPWRWGHLGRQNSDLALANAA
jgi:ferrochelatase